MCVCVCVCVCVYFPQVFVYSLITVFFFINTVDYDSFMALLYFFSPPPPPPRSPPPPSPPRQPGTGTDISPSEAQGKEGSSTFFLLFFSLSLSLHYVQLEANLTMHAGSVCTEAEVS